jgi:coenzyme PQQ biosynthesis protein PqqD
MICHDSCPKRVEQVIAQKASSDWLLFNMSDGNYYSLNDIGGRIWELCDGTRTVSQLVASISAEYDAAVEDVEKDVVELLEGLQHGKLIA